MGCEMSQANPFIPSGREYGAVDTESRLRALEDFDLEQCRAALALPGLQKTVEKKLRSRIRALEKLVTTVQQAEGAQEARERFEAWASEHFFSSCFEQFDGKYASRALQATWELWQARATLAQPSAPEPYAWFWWHGTEQGVLTLRQDYEQHLADYPGMKFLPVYAVPFAQGEQLPDLAAMVSRFLAWKLPSSVRPDPCVMDPDYPHRYGTNLLTADQAKAMLEHVMGGSHDS